MSNPVTYRNPNQHAIVPTPGVPNFPEILDRDKTTIPRNHQSALLGILNFLYYPNRDQLRRYHAIALNMSRPPDAPAEPIFVGQVPHLMPVEVIAWVVDSLLKKYSVLWMIRSTKTGCVKVWVTNRDDLEKLLEFSKCVMFDLNGIWHTSVSDQDLRECQKQELEKHCENIKTKQSIVDARLPKGSMVLELIGQPNPIRKPTFLETIEEMRSRRPCDSNPATEKTPISRPMKEDVRV